MIESVPPVVGFCSRGSFRLIFIHSRRRSYYLFFYYLSYYL